jgi:hypothetical protein
VEEMCGHEPLSGRCHTRSFLYIVQPVPCRDWPPNLVLIPSPSPHSLAPHSLAPLSRPILSPHSLAHHSLSLSRNSIREFVIVPVAGGPSGWGPPCGARPCTVEQCKVLQCTVRSARAPLKPCSPATGRSTRSRVPANAVDCPPRRIGQLDHVVSDQSQVVRRIVRRLQRAPLPSSPFFPTPSPRTLRAQSPSTHTHTHTHTGRDTHLPAPSRSC